MPTSRSSPRITRRTFLGRAAAMAGPAIVPASVLGRGDRPAPSERVTMGFIGLGNRGMGVMEAFLKHPDVQAVAICDVHDLHYRDRDWGEGRALGREPGRKNVEAHYAAQERKGTWTGCTAYRDYRELCARDDLDAVMVATPDHWHAIQTLKALRSGKDVYCEKPVTHFFAEGQLVYREAAKRGAVFQVGCQHRSEDKFRRAVEIVRNGHLGKIRRVEVGLPQGYGEPRGDATVSEPPKGLDYELWTGPAEVMPYMRARHHRWWRGHLNYGGGNIQDFIPHYNDIAHFAIGEDRGGPLRVEARGWTASATDIYNTPVDYEIHCAYAGGIESLIGSGVAAGVKWIGDEGWLQVGPGPLTASDPAWLGAEFDPGPWKIEVRTSHQRNFTDCVKSRDECTAPAEFGHRAITPGYLGYVSHALGRALQWNAAGEQVTGDDEAQRLLMQMHHRAPWVLPAG